MKQILVSIRNRPAGWAVKQRYLIDSMNRAAPEFVRRYTHPDGTLIWRSEWPGMDGSDDGYESFLSFPLLYLLGGSDEAHELSRRLWESVTWQFTKYGQIHNEYDGNYDWMHHGESSTYMYYFGLADPYRHRDRSRAFKFADMYTGYDDTAQNWDAEHKMIRSPINGSRGPCTEMQPIDWVTHRAVLANYLSPYEDVPGLDPNDPFAIADWNDEATYLSILELMNKRMVPGDVPLNLNATSLVTNAFMYSHEERYRKWTLDYLAAWKERTKSNDGIMPDNIGPSGIAGERMDGKWWGGYYGWRWPHGAWIILESTLISGCNATLLSGDHSSLDLHRSQGDLLWSLKKEEAGKTLVPYRHGNVGWFDYREPRSRHYIHLWFMSRDKQDLDRLQERFPDRQSWYEQAPTFGKSGHFWPERWYGYIAGENPSFPDQVLDDTYQCMTDRLNKIDNDDWGELESWDVHHWQDLNPVVPEGLIQMAMGTPAAVYHGGLLHASVRYFDAEKKRPGLPEHIAALVESIDKDGIVLTLVNTDPLAGHEVIVQGGAFGEHRFDTVALVKDGNTENPQKVDTKFLSVSLGPWATATFRLEMTRFALTPTYDFPKSIMR